MRSQPQFHNLLGFTQDEIKTYFKYQIELLCKKKGKSEEELLRELKEHYNGYKYHVNVDIRLSNAYDIQNYFHNEGSLENFWDKSGSPKNLLKFLNMQNISDLWNYLNMMAIKNFRLHATEEEFNTPPEEWRTLQKDFKQNALDAGYLTIDTKVQNNKNGLMQDEIALKIPNLEISQSFKKLLREYLVGNNKLGFIPEYIRDRDFDQLLLEIETVAFRNKTFLNLHGKSAKVSEIVEKPEILLHFIIAMTFEYALDEEEKNSLIRHYILENEKALPNDKS